MRATQWEVLGKRAKIAHQGAELAKTRREAGTLPSNENDWGKQRLDPLCIFADVSAEGKFAERAHMSAMWTKASEYRIWEIIPLECSLQPHLSSLSQIVSSQKKSDIYSLPYLYRSSSELREMLLLDTFHHTRRESTQGEEKKESVAEPEETLPSLLNR